MRTAQVAQSTAQPQRAGAQPHEIPDAVGKRAHGTRARYAWGPGPGAGPGCRCPDCAAANRQDAARRSRLQAYGQWEPYVDAEPVRAHLRALSRAGIGWKRAAQLSGISSGAVSKLLFGGPGDRKPAMRVRPQTASAILAIPVTPASLSAGSLVPAAGARRRLQALVAIGWSQSQLAARLSMQPSNFGSLMTREHVRSGTARAVQHLYDQLWNRPPAEADRRSRISASRARGYAEAHGWPPPLAWDDDLIDDPAATPAPGWERRDGRLRRSADIAEDVAELERQGYTRQQIAGRLGVTRAALEKAISRTAQQLPALSAAADSQQAPGAEVRLSLPASPVAPRQARAAIRQAVTSWGLGALSADAELLASELVANAAEHGSGQPITLALRQQAPKGGQPGIVCEVTDGSPALPQPRLIQPDSERGRGLAIVAALATDSGVTAKPDGKTAWFTLTAPAAMTERDRHAEPEAGS
jgi:anti-sigma regulatory factor (Ser/Thr protein kinase)